MPIVQTGSYAMLKRVKVSADKLTNPWMSWLVEHRFGLVVLKVVPHRADAKDHVDDEHPCARA